MNHLLTKFLNIFLCTLVFLFCSILYCPACYPLEVKPSSFTFNLEQKDKDKIKISIGEIEITNNEENVIILKKIRTSCSSCIEVVKKGKIAYFIQPGETIKFSVNIINPKIDSDEFTKNIYLEFKNADLSLVTITVSAKK